MRVLILILMVLINACSIPPKDLKSPCVSASNPDGSPAPCVKRSVNDKWLG